LGGVEGNNVVDEIAWGIVSSIVVKVTAHSNCATKIHSWGSDVHVHIVGLRVRIDVELQLSSRNEIHSVEVAAQRNLGLVGRILEINNHLITIPGAEVELDDVVAFTSSKTAMNCRAAEDTGLNFKVAPGSSIKNHLAWTIFVVVVAVEGSIMGVSGAGTGTSWATLSLDGNIWTIVAAVVFRSTDDWLGDDDIAAFAIIFEVFSGLDGDGTRDRPVCIGPFDLASIYAQILGVGVGNQHDDGTIRMGVAANDWLIE